MGILMNKYILEQLKKCVVADVPPLNGDEESIYVPMGDKRMNLPTLQVNNYYLIKLENYITNPPQGFTLHVNWNKGIVPVDTYMKCHVEQIMGKMVRINGVGFDYENKVDKSSSWEGWLPIEAVSIIQQL